MRRQLTFLLAAAGMILGGARALSAQSSGPGWALIVGSDFSMLRGAARSTDSITLRPSDGFAFTAGASRRFGRWEADVELGYQPTHVQSFTSALSVQYRGTTLDRYRLELLLGRAVGRVGSGRMVLLAGPVLENWSVEGEDGRTSIGASARLALRFPLGSVAMEQAVGFEWTDGPFDQAELPNRYEKRPLRVITLGTRLRLGL